MIKKYLKRLIFINKQAVLMEVLSIQGLMELLMKIRNTDEKWTFLSSAHSCRGPRSEEDQKTMREKNRSLPPGLFCLTENSAFHILKLPAHPVRTGQARRGLRGTFRSTYPDGQEPKYQGPKYHRRLEEKIPGHSLIAC